MDQVRDRSLLPGEGFHQTGIIIAKQIYFMPYNIVQGGRAEHRDPMNDPEID